MVKYALQKIKVFHSQSISERNPKIQVHQIQSVLCLLTICQNSMCVNSKFLFQKLVEMQNIEQTSIRIKVFGALHIPRVIKCNLRIRNCKGDVTFVRF
jgi:hypothetical protein